MCSSDLTYFQDKKLKSIVSTKKKGSRTKNQGGKFVSVVDVDWERVGSVMERNGTECRERYAYIQHSHGGKGPVPWTRDEDKQIIDLVAQHGMYLIILPARICWRPKMYLDLTY